MPPALAHKKKVYSDRDDYLKHVDYVADIICVGLLEGLLRLASSSQILSS